MNTGKTVRYALCLVTFVLTSANATLIRMEGVSGATSTGDQFEGVGIQWATNDVLEIAGLELRAHTADPGHILNANVGYFGINSDLADEDARAFDVGEVMQLSFSADVRINGFDFNLFDDTETFDIISGGVTNRIAYADLDNKSTDVYSVVGGWIIEKDQTVTLQTSSGSIGMDGFDIDVIPEPMVASLISLMGIGTLVVRRLFQDG